MGLFNRLSCIENSIGPAGADAFMFKEILNRPGLDEIIARAGMLKMHIL
jgi:hypothetical protein